MNTRRREILWQCAVLLLSIALWHLFSLTPVARTVSMPGPATVAASLASMMTDLPFWGSLGATIANWLTALVIAALVGIPVGMFLGRVRRASLSAGVLIDFLRTIPSFALVPILLLLLGPEMSMVVVAAAFAGVWPLLIQAMYASAQLDPVLTQVSQAFRLGFLDRLRFVLVPDFIAFLWPGLRLATTATLMVTIGAELIGGAPGIGSAMQEAQLYNLSAVTYSWVAVAAVLGLAVNGLILVTQRKILWWHPTVRGARR